MYNLNVGGAIILMLDKTKVNFTEQYMNFTMFENHALYIMQCQQAFMSLVYAYYNRMIVQASYNQYLDTMEEL